MQIQDEITTGMFGIEMGKYMVETVQAVSGIRFGQDVVETRQITPEGEALIRRQPGADQSGEVIITRGMDKSTQFTEWIKQTVVNRDVDSARQNIAITALDAHGNPVRRINLFNAWASNWAGPSLDAGSGMPATEQVTIVYEDMSVE